MHWTRRDWIQRLSIVERDQGTTWLGWDRVGCVAIAIALVFAVDCILEMVVTAHGDQEWALLRAAGSVVSTFQVSAEESVE